MLKAHASLGNKRYPLPLPVSMYHIIISCIPFGQMHSNTMDLCLVHHRHSCCFNLPSPNCACVDLGLTACTCIVLGMKVWHHMQQCDIQHARQIMCNTIESDGCCCCCATRSFLVDATRHDQGLSHTSGRPVCLCAVQGAAERASPNARAWCGGTWQGTAASRHG